jgi:DUF438 domain-containing protein
MMTSIHEVMTHDHRTCDGYFAIAEKAVTGGDWAEAEAAWHLFSRVLENHITLLEEEILFPAFESVNGKTEPTQVMRMEHRQLRTLVESMQQVLSRKDANEFLGMAETTMLMLQQHNMKEERVLYPLMDRLIANPAEFTTLLQQKVSASHLFASGHTPGT